MGFDQVLQRAWHTTKSNFIRKRYLTPSNFLSDSLAGNITRTPLYTSVDKFVVGASEEAVIGSAINGLGMSLAGWSLVYIMGNSIVAESLGDYYTRHKAKVDAAYSAVMSFGFGMGINLAAGYTPKQAIIASSLRGLLAIPLGPVTRYYSDAFREIRNEPSITPQGAAFRNRKMSHTLPRLATMIGVPLMLMYGALEYSNSKSTKPASATATQETK